MYKSVQEYKSMRQRFSKCDMCLSRGRNWVEGEEWGEGYVAMILHEVKTMGVCLCSKNNKVVSYCSLAALAH